MKYKKNILWLSIVIIFAQLYAVEKKRILVASPIRQKPGILKEFLQSLLEVKQEKCSIDYYFIDDNIIPESSELLKTFAGHITTDCVIEKAAKADDTYVCNETTHYWREAIVWKVASFKDGIIRYADQQSYDYLFLIDSDIVLHPDTIEHLSELQKDIVSEIFWTSWSPGSMKLPQVWLYDHYTQYEIGIGEQISDEERNIRFTKFIQMLQKAGVYEVGGLGACTLLSKKALEAGVSFSRIKNVTLWGEDRHFCIRAAALGFPLHVDTHYPAYHIYRETDLAGVAAFKENCRNNNYCL